MDSDMAWEFVDPFGADGAVTYVTNLFGTLIVAAAVGAVIAAQVWRILDARNLQRLREERAAASRRRRPDDPDMSGSGSTVAVDTRPEVDHESSDAPSGGPAEPESDD